MLRLGKSGEKVSILLSTIIYSIRRSWDTNLLM